MRPLRKRARCSVTRPYKVGDMTTNRTALALVVAMQFANMVAAHADCPVPKKPVSVPDGSSASADEMNTAKTALENFEKAVKQFQTCVEADTKTKAAALGKNVDAIKQLRSMAEKRVTVFNDELQKQADSYTEQMSTWKLTNRQ
jgi:hypothetical protein